MRSLLLRMVLFIVALHAVAIAIWYGLDVEGRGGRVRSAYVVVWTVATVLLASYFLRRIRLIRRGYDVK